MTCKTSVNSVATVSIDVVELVSSLSSMQVIQAAGGSEFSLVITTAGEVFSWGRNDKGQLGRGKLSKEEERKPKYEQHLRDLKL